MSCDVYQTQRDGIMNLKQLGNILLKIVYKIMTTVAVENFFEFPNGMDRHPRQK